MKPMIANVYMYMFHQQYIPYGVYCVIKTKIMSTFNKWRVAYLVVSIITLILAIIAMFAFAGPILIKVMAACMCASVMFAILFIVWVMLYETFLRDIDPNNHDEAE